MYPEVKTSSVQIIFAWKSKYFEENLQKTMKYSVKNVGCYTE
jgi:hypothetical protein